MRIKKFQDWSLLYKVISASVTAVVFLASIVLFYVLPKVRENIYDEKRLATKNIVDIPYSLFGEYDARVQKGELTLEEAQHRAQESVKNMRYNEKEYFWINDLTPRMIMHPYKPELVGKNLSENKDTNGKQLFLEMVLVCKEQGGGFVDYMWPKPGLDKPVRKISYVKLYKPWGWIVASGIYVDDVEDQISAIRWFIIGGLFVGICICIGIGSMIGRSVAKPLKEMVVRLENADLNTSLTSSRKDEIGDLTRSFDRFVSAIKSTLMEVSEVSSAVASASAEISSSTEQMAAGSQEQTAQATEVASAVEEMASTIIENSKNAMSTSQTAKEAKQAAQNGGRVVMESIEGMKRISAVVTQSAVTVHALKNSSNKIGEIIVVIDDIADQTNLLALNAAIEAARAGDQGRGFAVVADEVRKLAERTTKATKEISDMIKEIQVDTAGAVVSIEGGTTEVEKGIALAERAGQSLDEIVLKSEKLTDMISQIATASGEQSSASGQIAKNVEAISSVTAETAQGTQQIARAAEDLNKLTESLQQFVSRFKLSDGDPVAFGNTDLGPSWRERNPQESIFQKSATGVHENDAQHQELSLAGTFDIEAAKRAHLVWKSRIQKLLQGKERVDEHSVVSHRDCALGKWYYGVAQGEFGGDASYAALGQKHEEMHNSVRETARLWNAGNQKQAKVIAENVYRLSSEVVALLDQMSHVQV